MSKTFIFGAKATAAGLYKALQTLEPDIDITAFLVSVREGNPEEIWGCPVRLIASVAEELSDEEKKESLIYVAVPELIHREIKRIIESFGFGEPVMLNSRMEADMMERYFEAGERFRSVHKLGIKDNNSDLPAITIYSASFYRDKALICPPELPEYVKKIYLGCDGAVKAGIDLSGKADFYDNTGDNISEKNPNRCEMTAHYWVWKNRMETDDEYVGICHYRRILELSDEDLRKIRENDVDVILPYPMIHYPNAGIQHSWYVPEKDWQLMRNVVMDMYPKYGKGFDEVFGKPEFYNYNMLLAKKIVFSDYCAWLYPILDRIEELSDPKGEDRHDRYTAYMSESLETLYFMANLDHLKIYHTGRLLFS